MDKPVLDAEVLLCLKPGDYADHIGSPIFCLGNRKALAYSLYTPYKAASVRSQRWAVPWNY